MTQIKENPLQVLWEGRNDFFRGISSLHPLPLASCQETETYIRYTSGIDNACCNGIIEKKPDRALTEQEIDQAIAHFTRTKLPFVWWSSCEFLATKGFRYGGILKGISLSLVDPLTPVPQNIDIRVIRTDDEINHFGRIIGTCFGMNAQTAHSYAVMGQAVMEAGQQIHYLGYCDGQPVCTASLSVGANTAGLWNFATLPEYRKRGIGTAVTLATMHEAKRRGYEAYIAYLMPKGLAWNLCQKLGFQETSNEHFYVFGVNPDALEK